MGYFVCFFIKKGVKYIYNIKLNFTKQRRKNAQKQRERERVNASLLANLLFSRMNLIHIL